MKTYYGVLIMENMKETVLNYYELKFINNYSYNQRLLAYLDLFLNNLLSSDIEHYLIELLYIDGIIPQLTVLQRAILEYKRKNLNNDEISAVLSINSNQIKMEYEKSLHRIKKLLNIVSIN